ncbi:MAG: serine hydrolase [Cytophagales bacterium]|nr:serine hydrolase [Rhizobacter sp.]
MNQHQHPGIDKKRARKTRLAQTSLAIGALLMSAAAQADVLLQESFAAGLGSFTAAGTVTTGTNGARMQGCFGCTDGSIRSAAFSTVGFSNLTLNFSRSSSGLDTGEAGIVEFSTNGSTYSVLESSRTTSGAATFALPLTATGQNTVYLRFRVDASSSSETYTVANVRVEGTRTSTPPTTGASDPGTGPWALVSAANVAAQCKLDTALLQQANRTLGLSYAIVRYGKLCHEYYPSGRDSVSQVYSTTKTMGSLTVGALIHQTKNIPVTTTRKRGPLGEFQRVDHWLDSVTFQQASTTAHVLGMVSEASPNLNYPNREFVYDTVGSDAINRLSDVVNTVVTQDTARLGSNIGAFWQRYLATPLGFENSTWGTSNTSKNFATSWQTTVRDMARLGLLMNNGGMWNGQRLIDQDYVYNMGHTSFEDANTRYGYLTWLQEEDSCAPKPQYRSYPHGPVSNAPSCLRPGGCPAQQHDVGVFFAAGLGGQYIIVHRGLDMVIVVKDSGGQSGSEPMRFWEALRPAVIALDPTYRNNASGFCAAYGAGNYAPDLKLWEGDR